MRILTFILSVLFIQSALQAQNVEFTATASPKVLRVGQQFNLTYESNEEISDLTPPDLDNCELLGGPSQGHSTSVYNDNGKITYNSSYQYTYYFRATKEGKFTIPAATVKIKNKTYKSNEIDMEVLPANASASKPSQPANPETNNKNIQTGSNDVFVRLILNKNVVYLGEQIIATIKIYTKQTLSDLDWQFKGPDYTGFYTDKIDVPNLENLEPENVNGDIYYTGVLRKTLIMPQKTGEITIQPFDLDVAIRRQVKRNSGDPFFDNFFGTTVQDIPLKLKSNTVKITVKPLPPGAPTSFNGAVGDFKISSSINKTTVKTGDPLTLKVQIKGTGNLKLINDLNVNIPSDFERYDPVINTNMENAVSGSKSFDYLIIPHVPGNFIIPAIDFSYFNPETHTYQSLTTGDIALNVEKGTNDSTMAMVPGISKEDIRLLNQDIRFIKNKEYKLFRTFAFLPASRWYYLTYLALIFLFTIILLLRRYVILQNADLAKVRVRRADKFARKRLKTSFNLLKEGNTEAFYEEMLKALWGYLSDKLNIPVSNLSRETSENSLHSRGIEEDTTREFFRIVNQCEMARFAPASASVEMEKLYREALGSLIKLQGKLK